ncbi:MAG: hypothetical protein QNJ98_20040 [Planctomycetota bacterium]|nr:hypothetical protein [Planctomycetota bacterium]
MIPAWTWAAYAGAMASVAVLVIELETAVTWAYIEHIRESGMGWWEDTPENARFRSTYAMTWILEAAVLLAAPAVLAVFTSKHVPARNRRQAAQLDSRTAALGSGVLTALCLLAPNVLGIWALQGVDFDLPRSWELPHRVRNTLEYAAHFLPGALLTFRLWPAVHIAVEERCDPVAALRRAWRRGRGRVPLRLLTCVLLCVAWASATVLTWPDELNESPWRTTEGLLRFGYYKWRGWHFVVALAWGALCTVLSRAMAPVRGDRLHEAVRTFA